MNKTEEEVKEIAFETLCLFKGLVITTQSYIYEINHPHVIHGAKVRYSSPDREWVCELETLRGTGPHSR